MNMHAIFLGLIQGLTEFLPISSSGHLILIPKLFRWPDQGLAFDIVVHLGTLLAVLFVFKKRIREILNGIFGAGRSSDSNAKLGSLIIISIIPAALVGFLLGNFIEENFRSKNLVALSLIFWALVMWRADKYYRKPKRRITDVRVVGVWQTIAVGLSQAIALIPGTSRSGITMTFGMFTKMDRRTAVEFSFLISIPVIAAAGGYGLLNLIKLGAPVFEIKEMILGFAAAFVSGISAIKFLLSFVKKRGFGIFVIYRILLGAAILILL